MGRFLRPGELELKTRDAGQFGRDSSGGIPFEIVSTGRCAGDGSIWHHIAVTRS